MISMHAYVDDFGKITAAVSRRFFSGQTDDFYINSKEGRVCDCTVIGHMEQDTTVVYILSYTVSLEFGHYYELVETHGLAVPLEYRHIVRTSAFDQMFTYRGDDLGAVYHPDHTDFALWAPTAISVMVRIESGSQQSILVMNRTDKGVFRARAEGDLKHALYRYLVERNGGVKETTDPYGLSSNANGKMSAVIDTEEILSISDPGCKEPLQDYVDAVIYECSVRDMTSSQLTGTRTNGKFSSLSEEGTSFGDLPTGLDYLISLGVTHVQLQPVIDYATVNELYPKKAYNWGYDPAQFMTLEGSYSDDANDPYARMKEFRKLVSCFHKHGIRVNMDVVWNHMYDTDRNPLNLTLPYYYYRYNDAGQLSNGSYCGNDLESRRPMFRHLLCTTINKLVRLYGIDGMRFDLMGILDVDTINLIVSTMKGLKPDAMLYGEGWDMPTALDGSLKATIYNHGRIPQVGHFNDSFRDVLKGKTGDGDKYDRGYLTGNRDQCFAACSVLTANVLGQPYFQRFDQPHQSINGVETHDNATVWDKMHACCSDEPRDVRMRRMKMMIACTLFAQGVPFLHQGIEFAGTKRDNSNSYNAGDSINQMNWERRQYNSDLVAYTQACIRLRRSNSLFRLRTAEEISRRVSFVFESDAVLVYDIDGRDLGQGMVSVVINPNHENKEIRFIDEWKVILNAEGKAEDKVSHVISVPSCSVIVLECTNVVNK